MSYAILLAQLTFPRYSGLKCPAWGWFHAIDMAKTRAKIRGSKCQKIFQAQRDRPLQDISDVLTLQDLSWTVSFPVLSNLALFIANINGSSFQFVFILYGETRSLYFSFRICGIRNHAATSFQLESLWGEQENWERGSSGFQDTMLLLLFGELFCVNMTDVSVA